MKKKTSILLMLLLFGLYHCATAEKLERARINPYWNDLALFLAGMPQRPENNPSVRAPCRYHEHILGAGAGGKPGGHL